MSQQPSSCGPSAAACRRPRATIIGCGVIGLTCGVMLQRHGFDVTIRTRTTPLTAALDPMYTSDKAGAHWFSFARTNEIQKQARDEICFQALSGLAVTEPDSGVSTIRGHSLFETPPSAHLARPWWHAIVPRFHVWTRAELDARTKETGVAYAHGFSYEAIMIHVPHYLNFLYRTFVAAGGVVRLGEVTHIREAFEDGSASCAPDVVVNCCGLGARSLGGVMDASVHPDRGQTIRVHAPEVTDIWRSPGPNATYILPRGDGTVILGGTHDDRGDTQHDAAVADGIVQRCARLLPLIGDAKRCRVVGHAVGLRPARGTDEQQRIEVDQEFSAAAASSSSSSSAPRLLVHAYGHGGDGFQSSWGTATAVLHLIHQARPCLFDQNQTFHMRHSQMRTDVLQRAGITHPQAKL